ncbi:HAMP domain-containing protein [Skermanella mucosa]|uniref:sensor histidine kinase n=1 Tax=Skermanella mucosa TaxID=1789672 RepID=UPI00192CDC98|nr:CHASE4 domain-containing protein [Skermanella mucosa]UEM20446.1 HAMP domain-containing protein [Skermanella mucosa]
MSLRLKILSVMALIAALMIAVSWILLQSLVVPGFEMLEAEEARRNLLRVEQALAAENEAFGRNANDWAKWDETAAFVTGALPEFPERNISAAVLRDMGVDVLLVVATDGSLLYGTSLDGDRLSEGVPAGLSREILPLAPADDAPDGTPGSIDGIVLSDRGPIIMAARAIQPTDRSGPALGTLVFGRVIDRETVAAVRRRVQIDVEFLFKDPATGAAFPEHGGHDHPLVLDRRDDVLVVTGMIDDMHGHHAMLARMTMPRDAALAAGRTVHLAMALLVVACGGALVILWLMLNRLILAPVLALTGHILSIRTTGDLARPGLVDRGDEIGALAREFDALLRQVESLIQESETARRSAEQASRTKTQFLASMSHELRTPLNAIIGFSEIIRDAMFGASSARYQDYAEDIHRSGQHLLALINDILDFSKAEAERIELHEEAVDLPRAVATCRHLVEPMARDGNIDIAVQFADRSVRLVWADELRLRQIILNLLTNAIKFTAPGGEVRIRVGRQADGGAEIRVEDNGIGMSPEGVAKALEPFGQIESALSRRHSGTGLGLPLTAHLVNAHGGRLVIESSLGWGTTVRVGLPPARLMDDRLTA